MNLVEYFRKELKTINNIDLPDGVSEPTITIVNSILTEPDRFHIYVGGECINGTYIHIFNKVFEITYSFLCYQGLDYGSGKRFYSDMFPCKSYIDQKHKVKVKNPVNPFVFNEPETKYIESHLNSLLHSVLKEHQAYFKNRIPLEYRESRNTLTEAYRTTTK